MRFDPLVLAYQAVAMQRIADYVRSGHNAWTGGEVPLHRAAALVRKFDRLYGIGRTRNQRATDKSHSVAGATLILYCPQTAAGQPHTDTLRWVLLVTAGESLAHTVEKLQDARLRPGRLRWGDYELVQIARPGQVKPAWSWRLKEAAYEDWRHRILQTVRQKNPFQIEQLQAELLRLPGFSGVRVQGKKLLALHRQEYMTHHKCAVMQSQRLRFVQRLPNRGEKLSALLRQNAASTKASDAVFTTSD
jgi:hypothetical protein